MLRFLLSPSRVQFGSQTCSINSGVPQGSTISPYLFNIYADGLRKVVEILNVRFKFFADDIVIYGELE